MRSAITFLFCVWASFVLCGQDTTAGATIKFDTTIYWFDTVFQGSIIDHEFRFTNTGKVPLVISNVQGSSGSVVPEWPKNPVAPGKTAVIRVVFHTGGRMGPQEKTVTVTSNATEPQIILRVKGVVILPPKKDEFPPPAQQNRIGQ